ncbi:hypothetical protein C8Q79DRAFT_902247, partial [Trametes meyenii]
MVKVAKKYGVKCEVRNPAADLRGRMPIWYHIGEGVGRSSANSTASRCLRERHNVEATEDCARVAARLDTAEHRPRKNCDCLYCDRDRRVNGCGNPHRCAVAAERAVSKLCRTWNPKRRGNNDGLTLTKNREEANAVARTECGRVIFDPTMTTTLPVGNVFRAFVRPGEDCGVALRPAKGRQVEQEEVEIHTDGACVSNGMANARAGSGLWYGPDDPRNMSVRVPMDRPTNQVAEFYAVLVAAKETPPFAPLHIVSD